MQWIDYGLGGLTSPRSPVRSGRSDLADLYHSSPRRQLFGYEATERFYEIGQRSAETGEFLAGADAGKSGEVGIRAASIEYEERLGERQ